MVSTIRIVLILLASLTLGACGKSKEPMPRMSEKNATEQAAAEKAANDKSVRDNAVWGAQVQSLDKARGVQATLDQQAEDARKKIDDSSK